MKLKARPSVLPAAAIAGFAAGSVLASCSGDLHLGHDGAGGSGGAQSSTTSAGGGSPLGGGGSGNAGGGGGAGGSGGQGGAGTLPPIGPPICSSDGWCWSLPLPQGNTLRGAACFAENDVWAVGDFGTLMHYDGSQWSRAPQITDANVVGISALGPHRMYAVSDGGDVLEYHNGSWTAQKPLALRYAAVSATSANDIWAYAPHDLAHYDGTSWSTLAVQVPYARQVRALSPHDVYLTNDLFDPSNSSLLHYDGSTFQPVATSVPPVRTLTFTSPTDVWAFGRGVSHFDGTAWTEFHVVYEPGDGGNVNDLWATSADDAWAAADYGILHYSTSVGYWTQLPSNFGALYSPVFTSLSGCTVGPDAVWVVGDPGLAYWNGHLVQALSPQAFGFNIDGNVRALWFADENDVYGGEGFANLHFDGASWTASSAFPDSLETNDAAGTSSNDVWLVGRGGQGIATRTDHWDGVQWTEVPNPFDSDIASVWTPAPNDVWVAGDGILGHYDGSSWINDPLSAGVTFSGIHGISGDDVWAVAAQDVYHHDASGWSLRATLPATVNAVWAASAAEVWAVGDGVFHFDGVTWSAVTAPAATLRDVWGSAADDVYAVGDAGVILHFDGTTWTRMDSGTSRDLFTVIGNGPNHVFVGGGHGAILRRDG